MKTLLVNVVLLLALSTSHAEDRLWVNAKISGKPARLALDTGFAGEIGLFRPCADRLGLKLRPAGAMGTLPLWQTKTCIVRLQGWSFWGFPFGIGHIPVVEIPTFLKNDLDGCVGWPAIRHRVIEFDAGKRTFNFLDQVPEEAAGWTKMAVEPNSGILALKRRNLEGGDEIILVDTGSGGGVALGGKKWQEWESSHPNLPLTLTADFVLDKGIRVYKQTWADRFTLGSLEMSDLLVEEDVGGGKAWAGPAESIMTLGTAALGRLDFIVDGKHNVAYLRPKATSAKPRQHNRLGAVFVPRDPSSEDLLAHVAAGSPAAEAGIRDGDVLLNMSGHDATNWRKDRAWAFSDERPAGTKLEVTVWRDGERLKLRAVLRDILVPKPASSSSM